MWPPANITVSSYLSGFKPTDKLQFERERRIDAPQKAIHEYILFAFIYL